MLSKAQEFLNLITLSCLVYPLVVHILDQGQQLINKYKTSQKTSFVASFFKLATATATACARETMECFVYEFNRLVLTIHILMKKLTHALVFVPTSPIAFSPTRACLNCTGCGFIESDGSVQCDECGLIIRNQIAVAWSDVSRVHAAPIYSYDKKVQFKECILQYQGRCNAIDYELLNCIAHSPSMTKIDFLHALKAHTKQRSHIEQVHALYYHAVGKTPPNLTCIENNLLQDFDCFIHHYSKSKSHNYISNQYLLYQFLNRYGFVTSKADVLLVDYVDSIPDKQCQAIFQKLNWKIYN